MRRNIATSLTPELWGARTTRLRRPLQRRSSSTARPRPPHPRPTSRDDRETPLCERRDAANHTADSIFRKNEIFLRGRIDRVSRIAPVGQITWHWLDAIARRAPLRLSPCGRGRNASQDAFRVRGLSPRTRVSRSALLAETDPSP